MGSNLSAPIADSDSLEARSSARRKTLGTNNIRPSLTTFFVPLQKKANYLVLTGRPEHLIHILKKNPAIFFTKYKQSHDAAEQKFFNVSPADLISFICDADMKKQVDYFAQHLPAKERYTFQEQQQEHLASRGRGGADLIMVSGTHPPLYSNVCNTTNTFYLLDGSPTIQRSLLKNPDGVVCWKDPDNLLHWYYANLNTQTLSQIDISHERQAAHQAEYSAFVSRMTNMEPDTARRSSNQEHELIATIMLHHRSQMPVHLHREGIHYQQDGIDYIDTHYDFNRIVNAYLKCIRLYATEMYSLACAELSLVQHEVMWLIQRYCEIDQSFSPLADDYQNNPFVRSFDIFLQETDKKSRIFDVKNNQFIPAFEKDNSDRRFLFKSESTNAALMPVSGAMRPALEGLRDSTDSIFLPIMVFFGAILGKVDLQALSNLLAVHRLIVDAIQDFEPNPEASASQAPSTIHQPA